jgi:hypothetical protein
MTVSHLEKNRGGGEAGKRGHRVFKVLSRKEGSGRRGKKKGNKRERGEK